MPEKTYVCGTLAECHGPPEKNKYGALLTPEQRPKFISNEFISSSSFDNLLEAVYQDMRVEETPAGLAGLEYGRGGYDTPLWNGYGNEDTTIYVYGHGRYTRSEVNYIAQGMWGAQAGEPLPMTLAIVEGWNWTQYDHFATEGELYWATYGWMYYHERVWQEASE